MASSLVSPQSAMATMPSPAAAQKPEPDRPEDDAPRCILIVEDVGGQRRTLSLILKREGFKIVACASGEEGLEAAREHEIAVAVLDYKLPDLTGIEILEELKKIDERTQGILHTAYGSFDSARDAVNLGAFAFLEKPSDPAEMVRCVHRAASEWMRRTLQRSEERSRLLEAALDQAELPVAVTAAGPDPAYVYANPAFLRMSGFDEAELIGQTPKLLYGPKTRRNVVERLRERQQAGRSFVGETIHHRKDGSSFLMEVRVDPVRDGGGEITHWVMIYR